MTETTDPALQITVEDLAMRCGRPPWMMALSMARYIEAGLVDCVDGTPTEAAASLRILAQSYGE